MLAGETKGDELFSGLVLTDEQRDAAVGSVDGASAVPAGSFHLDLLAPEAFGLQDRGGGQGGEKPHSGFATCNLGGVNERSLGRRGGKAKC